MVEQEETKLNSRYEHIKNTSTCGAVLTENKLEAGRKTLINQGCKERSTWKSGGEENRSGQDLCPRRGHRREGDYTGSEILLGE